MQQEATSTALTNNNAQLLLLILQDLQLPDDHKMAPPFHGIHALK